jgi:hypothetical protein
MANAPREDPELMQRLPDPEHAIGEFSTQKEALEIQSRLFDTHKIRASLLQCANLWVLEYFPKPHGPTITEARAITQAYQTALKPITVPTKGEKTMSNTAKTITGIIASGRAQFKTEALKTGDRGFATLEVPGAKVGDLVFTSLIAANDLLAGHAPSAWVKSEGVVQVCVLHVGDRIPHNRTGVPESVGVSVLIVPASQFAEPAKKSGAK